MQWGLRLPLDSRFSCIDLVKSHMETSQPHAILRALAILKKNRLHVNDKFLDDFLGGRY